MSTPSGSNNRRATHNVGSFPSFLEGWLVRQEHYLDELNSAQQNCHQSRDEDLKELISRVLSHYQEYYDQKSRVVNRNVYGVFSPSWFTPFERTLFWIAGFKPGLAFGLVTNSVSDLTEEQSQRMSQLMGKTKMEERVLSDKLARIQESVAAPPLLELARRTGVLRNGESSDMDAVLETLRSAMEVVVVSADLLRTTTAERVVEILSPVQNVKFLAAATQLQLKIRTWGLQKEAERGTNNNQYC